MLCPLKLERVEANQPSHSLTPVLLVAGIPAISAAFLAMPGLRKGFTRHENPVG